ncbi:MAG: hypothetical protein IJU71_10930, partial [Selenomonadaceae bacterium]|nr:hypothetical protein [Selenomonadaceae bacterium]
MQNLFLGMTLGNDPHALGIFNAGKIARMLGIKSEIIPINVSDEEKLRRIAELDPVYVGLSYRLSTDNAIYELKKFLELMDQYDLLNREGGRRICFAALQPALNEVRRSELDRHYGLYLMDNHSDVEAKTICTAKFFGAANNRKLEDIIEFFRRENDTAHLKMLNDIAAKVLDGGQYLSEPKLIKPSAAALQSLTQRMVESDIPLIRSHFGVPDETIFPTVDGIKRIALNGAIDEWSIGSSDLSQRYYGQPQKFKELKNDGGVPYKDIHDLKMLADASRLGNFPSVKPYCHVRNIIPFIDDCLAVGMLRGAHQAIPLFWFSELDGRGDMTLEDAVAEHIRAVNYLASKNIPVEMNDPNQWMTRYVHDSLFVLSYALILSVMYAAGVKDIVLQCQFNVPATTGDYADLGKFLAVKKMAEALRPVGNTARIHYETRSGIEHFSPNLSRAKFQLARSVLLQMLINPSMLHLVSYCEAHHVATADDVIESSKILRRAVRLFKGNEFDIRRSVDVGIVHDRAAHLFSEAMFVIDALTDMPNVPRSELYKVLSKPDVLIRAVKQRYLTAPGINCVKYADHDIITKAGRYGYLDCYESW